jgi:hypothetical protein
MESVPGNRHADGRPAPQRGRQVRQGVGGTPEGELETADSFALAIGRYADLGNPHGFAANALNLSAWSVHCNWKGQASQTQIVNFITRVKLERTAIADPDRRHYQAREDRPHPDPRPRWAFRADIGYSPRRQAGLRGRQPAAQSAGLTRSGSDRRDGVQLRPRHRRPRHEGGGLLHRGPPGLVPPA